jgi:D-tyrosyl-tRNA(Tyr) deacylase
VTVDGNRVAEIGPGLLALVGVAQGDTVRDAEWLAQKTVELRVFDDEQGKMNRSLLDVAGSLLAVSQFTLLGDCRKGRRPSFTAAAPPEPAQSLFEHFVATARGCGIAVQTGQFRTVMQVALVNDGPVTLCVDSYHGPVTEGPKPPD